MSTTHILFGGIGTLVETSATQLAAFNQAFANLGIDFVWSQTDYAASLTAAGGQNRLRQLEWDDGGRLSDEQIAAVHAEKTRLFNALIARDGLALRAGVAALIASAQARAIACAWVTTTARANIDAIFHAAGDALTPDLFAYIGDATRVASPKPAPDCYRAALDALGARPECSLAVEDSPTGVQSAVDAGVPTAALPGRMHHGHDFSRADRVVASAADLVADLDA